MSAAELAALLTAAAGVITAVTALIHSIRTRAIASGSAQQQPRGPRGG